MNKITLEELQQIFGDALPWAAVQILTDATDDRTPDDVRAELRALAAMIKETDRA